MPSEFAKGLLKVSVAQICQNIGWNAVQGSPLEALVDILHRYLSEISKTTHQYSNQYGRSEPNLIDLALAFRLMGVQLSELEEYVNNVEPVPFVHQVAAFPLPHRSNFQFPKPNSRAIAQRPEWVSPHLPPMNKEQEEEDAMPPSPLQEDPTKRVHTIDDSSSSSDDRSLNGSPKQPRLNANGTDVVKRKKLSYEEEGRPMREMTSIFMTPSGVIAPSRDGKLPDSQAPSKLPDSRPPTPELSSDSSSSSSISLPNLPLKKPFKIIKKDKAKLMKIKKDLVLKKQMKKLKMNKKQHKINPHMSHKPIKTEIPLPPPLFIKKEGRNIVMGEPVKIKSKKKKSSDLLKMTKSKPAITKIRIAKDKSMTKEVLKSPKIKHKIKINPSPPISTPRSPKSPKGAKFSSLPKSTTLNRSPKVPLHFQKDKSPVPPNITIPIPPVIVIPKPPIHEFNEPILPVKIEPLQASRSNVEDYDDIPSRDDTPEPRLIIDDEAQARHEKESRMAVLDECINAVIIRATEEFEVEGRNMDDAIDSVIKSSGVKKLEPRDVYDFTDSSDGGGSLPQTPKTPEPTLPAIPPAKIKKDKKVSPESGGLKALAAGSDSGKKKKTKTSKKKPVKDKPKPPPLSFSKFGRSGTQRAPSPSFDDSDSSDIQSLPSPGGPAVPNQLSPIPRNSFGNFQQPNSLFSSLPMHKFPSMGFTATPSPFSPLRSLPSNPFPTPPLFVPPPKMDQMGGAQMQPLNLAISGTKERKGGASTSNVDNPKRGLKLVEEDIFSVKGKSKDHKKKPEKKEKPKKKLKEKLKIKKEMIPQIPVPSPPPPDPSPPPSPLPPPLPVHIAPPEPKKSSEKKQEKVVKSKPEKKPKTNKVEKEKKKGKEKEEKTKEEPSNIPKITFKLGGNTPHASGSTKITIKSTGKAGSQPESPPPEVAPPSPIPSTPSPVPPPKAPTPTPPPVIAPPISPPPISVKSPPSAGNSSGRGRHGGRGRGSAKRPASPPPSCIVTTETLGTIVDASGNKIWICPACTRPDDGSPMIGCDECDDWYHWVCVGIVVPPKEEESWFCTRCIAKRQGSISKKRRKKHKKEK